MIVTMQLHCLIARGRGGAISVGFVCPANAPAAMARIHSKLEDNSATERLYPDGVDLLVIGFVINGPQELVQQVFEGGLQSYLIIKLAIFVARC